MSDMNDYGEYMKKEMHNISSSGMDGEIYGGFHL